MPTSPLPLLVAICAGLLGLCRPGLAEAPAQPPGEKAADPAVEWKAACAELEELSAYRPLFLDPHPFDELLAWVPEGKTIRVYDENCRPVSLSRQDDQLSGEVDVKTTFHKGVKRVEALTAHFGFDVSYTGPGWTEYEKDDRGRWQEVGGGGTGCLETRLGVLDRVSAESARYGGAVVSLKVGCAAFREVRGSCDDGSARTCRTCTRLQVEARSLSPGIGYGVSPPVVQQVSSQAVDCSQPCPEDSLGEMMARLNRTLEGQEFIDPDEVDDAVVLFRSHKACLRHRRVRGEKKNRGSVCD